MESHLLRMRGLKRCRVLPISTIPSVASFTDAWIETIYAQVVQQNAKVASFTDAWIETKSR